MIGQIDIEKTLQLQPNKECLFVSLATVLNHVVDVVNELQHDNSEKANCQGSVLTMVDNQVTANLPNIDLGELAFLSKENSDLQDELDRTRKVLDVAVDKLKGIKACYDDSYANPNFVNWHIVAQRLANDADDAIKEITALEQKDAK